VFGVQDIERAANCSNAYARQILRRMGERGLLKRVTRNIYTTQDDIYVVASNISYPSYISFWSASAFLGYTEQVLNVLQIACTRPVRSARFGNSNIEFVPMKHFFGYRKIRADNGEIFIAEDEKLMIDAFLRPEKCGNIDEIEKIFSNASFTEKKLVNYLRQIDSQSLIKRVGFMLEKTRGLDISGYFRLDKNYVVLDRVSGRFTETNPKWRVKV